MTHKTVRLVNPWSGVVGGEMTWRQVKEWAVEHIHATDREEWMSRARDAWRNDDGEDLGGMIIGS